jgi:hypothetical protein
MHILVATPTSLMRVGNISLTIGQGSGPQELKKYRIKHIQDGTREFSQIIHHDIRVDERNRPDS